MQSVWCRGPALAHPCDIRCPPGLGPGTVTVISDLPEWMSRHTVRLFADDSFLYRKIRSAADSIQLQHDLNQLAAWEQSWLMPFSPSKCQLLRITEKRSPIHDTAPLYITWIGT